MEPNLFPGVRHEPFEHLAEPLPARLLPSPVQPHLHAASDSRVLRGNLDPGHGAGAASGLEYRRVLPIQPRDPHVLVQQGGSGLLPQDHSHPVLHSPHVVHRLLELRHFSVLEAGEDELDQQVPHGQK